MCRGRVLNSLIGKIEGYKTRKGYSNLDLLLYHVLPAIVGWVIGIKLWRLVKL